MGAWPIHDLTIEGVGAQGVFKKRPKVIKVRTDDGLLEMVSVMRLLPNSGVAQPGQEGALMSALGSLAVNDSYPLERRPEQSA